MSDYRIGEFIALGVVASAIVAGITLLRKNDKPKHEAKVYEHTHLTEYKCTQNHHHEGF